MAQAICGASLIPGQYGLGLRLPGWQLPEPNGLFVVSGQHEMSVRRESNSPDAGIN